MVCRKSLNDVGVAVFVLTIIMFSFGTTFYGLFRYIYDLEDDAYLSRDHLILAGNVLQVAAIGGTMVILSNLPPGPLQLGITLTMFLLLILVLYLTNFDPSNKGSAWSALVFLIIDVYVKITAVFMGFGVCSVDEVPGAITQMGGTLLKYFGGRR
ncbi:MAG: hypothetical protein EB127_20840 [Alphaproteobacteria bacterium]|jgi:hypothetical protein|nr:hypothetical protein [Alphaproteobacteria bacterium]